MLDISTVGRQAESCGLSKALWGQQDPRGKLGGAETERASTGEGRRLQAVRGVWREHSFSRLWFWLERKICLSLCDSLPWCLSSCGVLPIASRWQCLNFMSAECKFHEGQCQLKSLRKLPSSCVLVVVTGILMCYVNKR